MTTFSHTGPWDKHSRSSPPLVFLESYFSQVDALNTPPLPASTFYAPLAICHDTKGFTHIGSEHIWSYIFRLLAPFDKVDHEVVSLSVWNAVEKRVVHAEFMTRFWFRGEEDEVVVPQLFVFEIVERDMEGEGWWIERVKAFWDMAVLGRWITERRQREMGARKRVRAGEDEGCVV